MDRLIYGANWYCDETKQWQRVDETTLPVLEREMVQYVMGGGYFGLDLPAEIRPLSCEQTVNGEYEDLRVHFGRDPGDWTTLRYFQKLINVFPASSNGDVNPTTPTPARALGRVVFLKGLLTSYTPGAVKGLKASAATRLRWQSIVLYHDIVDGRTIHKFDAQNNILIIDGQNYTAEHNRLLAI
ncbi:hypothetical protein DEM27_31900 [Metarhizobium album]|uniref:Phage tail protein n=1 Tax=Metarhizobium album TaxID=2182425 RepID=A0A2U2DG05_9HYPH|nr:phage major tail tube protein [Rhizobium album]PWE52253.1 hypothetical protein DEM27_31900 [Rhizobium album]